MKKTFLFFGFLSVLLLFNSCKKEEIIYRDYHYHHYYNTLETVIVTIYERDWNQVNTNSEEYFYYEIEIDEITSSVINNGYLNVYLQVDNNGYIDSYPLPDVKTWDDGEDIFTEVISYELLSPNILAIKVERTDLYSIRPSTMKFKVVITKP